MAPCSNGCLSFSEHLCTRPFLPGQARRRICQADFFFSFESSQVEKIITSSSMFSHSFPMIFPYLPPLDTFPIFLLSLWLMTLHQKGTPSSYNNQICECPGIKAMFYFGLPAANEDVPYGLWIPHHLNFSNI